MLQNVNKSAIKTTLKKTLKTKKDILYNVMLINVSHKIVHVTITSIIKTLNVKKC